MNKFKEYKIFILSFLTILLAIYIVYPAKTFTVSLYLDGRDASSASVIDLVLNYNKNLTLLSYSNKNLLKSLDNNRFLLLPNSNNLSLPLMTFKFKSKIPFLSKDITVSPKTQVYLSKIGPADLTNGKIKFKLNYE